MMIFEFFVRPLFKFLILDFSGSTCIMSLISNDVIYTANVGDSRGIMARK